MSLPNISARFGPAPSLEGGWRNIPETYFRTLGPEQIAERHRELSPAAKLKESTAEKPAATRRKPRGKL